MTRLFTLLAALALVAVACGDDDADVAAGGDADAPGAVADGGSLDGREFLSTAVTEDGEPRALVQGTVISLRFDDGVLGFSAGCNGGGGDYEVVDGVLVADGFSITEMGCDPARHDQDEWLMAFLAERPSVTLTDTTLTLATDTTTIELTNRELADPDRPLVGTEWVATGFIDGEVASSMAVDRQGRIFFPDVSTVEGFDGCNDFGGSAEVSDGSTGGPVEGDGEIQWGTLDATAKACDPGDYDAAFGAIFATGSAVYEIDGPHLTIRTSEGRGVTFRAADAG